MSAIDPRALAAAAGLEFGADGRPVLPEGWVWEAAGCAALHEPGTVTDVDANGHRIAACLHTAADYRTADAPHAVVLACIVDALLGQELTRG